MYKKPRSATPVGCWLYLHHQCAYDDSTLPSGSTPVNLAGTQTKLECEVFGEQDFHPFLFPASSQRGGMREGEGAQSLQVHTHLMDECANCPLSPAAGILRLFPLLMCKAFIFLTTLTIL